MAAPIPKKKNNVPDVTIRINTFVDDPTLLDIQNQFPELKIALAKRSVTRAHARLHIERELVEEILIRKIGNTKFIVDVGGNPTRHKQKQRKNVWSLCPILTPEDSIRQNERQKQNCKLFCNHKFEQCTCTMTLNGNVQQCSIPDVTISVHSLYYLELDEITKLVMDSKDGEHYAIVHAFGTFDGKTEGHYYNEASWHDNNGIINMNVVIDGQYTHKNLDWLRDKYYENDYGAITWQVWQKYGHSIIIQFVLAERNMQGKANKTLTLEGAILNKSGIHQVDIGLFLSSHKVWPEHIKLFQVPRSYFTSRYRFLHYVMPDKTIKIDKEVVAAVAFAIAGKARNPITYQTAYDHARNFLKKTNITPTEKAESIPYVATLGFLFNLDKEIEVMETNIASTDDKLNVLNNAYDFKFRSKYYFLYTFIKNEMADMIKQHPYISLALSTSLATGMQTYKYLHKSTPVIEKLVETVIINQGNPQVHLLNPINTYYTDDQLINTASIFQAIKQTITAYPKTTIFVLATLITTYVGINRQNHIKKYTQAIKHQYTKTKYFIKYGATYILGHKGFFLKNLNFSSNKTIHYFKSLVFGDRCMEEQILKPHSDGTYYDLRDDECDVKYGSACLGIGLAALQPSIPRNCKHNDIVAVVNRNSFIKPSPSSFLWTIIHMIWTNKLLRIHDKNHIDIKIKPIDFNLWVKRYPIHKRQVLIDAKNDIGNLDERKSSLIKSFIKKEHFMKSTTTDDPEYDPRLIQGMTPQAQVITGPWIYSWSNRMKQIFNSSSRINYTSGMNSYDLGKRFELEYNTFNNPINIEGDGSRFDAHVRGCIIRSELADMCLLGASNKIIRSVMLRQETTGYTRNGIKYRANERKSGTNETSCGNSNLNAKMHYTIFKLTNVKSYLMRVLGDDNSTIIHSEDSTNILPNIKKIITMAGFDWKLRVTDDLDFAEYCSGRFYPGKLGRNWAPKLGRLLCKLFYCKESKWNNNAKTRLQWIRGVAVGSIQDINHVPLIRAIVNRVLQLTEGVKAEPILDYNIPHSPFKDEVTNETWIFMEKIYGIQQHDFERLEAEIYNIKTLPCLIDDPIINKILAIDIYDNDVGCLIEEKDYNINKSQPFFGYTYNIENSKAIESITFPTSNEYYQDLTNLIKTNYMNNEVSMIIAKNNDGSIKVHMNDDIINLIHNHMDMDEDIKKINKHQALMLLKPKPTNNVIFTMSLIDSFMNYKVDSVIKHFSKSLIIFSITLGARSHTFGIYTRDILITCLASSIIEEALRKLIPKRFTYFIIGTEFILSTLKYGFMTSIKPRLLTTSLHIICEFLPQPIATIMHLCWNTLAVLIKMH